MLVVGYLLVGWWPFAFWPMNQVSWSSDRAGLRFEDDGIAYDSATLPSPAEAEVPGQPANYTIELWVEAGAKPATDVFHLLTIHDGRLPSPFVLGQWQHGIILRAATRDSPAARKIHEVGVDGALEEGRARFITVTGNAAGTDFYLEGVLVGHFPKFVLGSEVLKGRMILGNSPAGKHSWVGRFLGLAIHNRALEAAEIARHNVVWTKGLAWQFTNLTSLRALYLFNEGGGQRTGDISSNRHQLVIPTTYRPLQKEFLIPPWKDVSYDVPNYRDIVINVLGFIPFGFCFFLYRQPPGGARWLPDALNVVVAGVVISLTIETIQVWLPGRASSMTDLLCNTAGTLLGALFAQAIRPKAANAESFAQSV